MGPTRTTSLHAPAADPPPTPQGGACPQAVDPSPLVLVAGAVVAVLSTAAALTGLLWQVEPDLTAVTSVHDESVELYGEGLYRHDSVFKGAGFRGADLVTVLAVPMLLWLLIAYRRASLRAALIASALLTWFVYVYASLALGAAYNELFLVYVAIVAASGTALVRLIGSLDIDTVHARALTAAPYRGVAALLAIAGIVTAVVWLMPLVDATITGEPPALLDHYTTTVTDVLDLAIITPLALATAALAHRRHRATVAAAMPLLGLLIALLPMIAAQSAFQLEAGYDFAPGEIVGPVAGFVVLAPIAGWLAFRTLRAVCPPTGPPGP